MDRLALMRSQRMRHQRLRAERREARLAAYQDAITYAAARMSAALGLPLTLWQRDTLRAQYRAYDWLRAAAITSWAAPAILDETHLWVLPTDEPLITPLTWPDSAS